LICQEATSLTLSNPESCAVSDAEERKYRPCYIPNTIFPLTVPDSKRECPYAAWVNDKRLPMMTFSFFSATKLKSRLNVVRYQSGSFSTSGGRLPKNCVFFFGLVIER